MPIKDRQKAYDDLYHCSSAFRRRCFWYFIIMTAIIPFIDFQVVWEKNLTEENQEAAIQEKEVLWIYGIW